jgi:hypothetical protein
MRNFKSWVSIGAVLLLTMAILGTAVYARTHRVALGRDGCPLDKTSPPRRSIVLIVDQSDRFEFGDRKAVRLVAEEWLGKSEFYDRIAVVRPNAQAPFEPHVLFQECAPPSSRNANILTSTPTKLDEKWSEFRDEMGGAIDGMLQIENQPSSPLMETLVAVTTDGEIGASNEIVVIFFSDMLQKSRFQGKKMSFYGRVPDVEGARMKEFESYLGNFSFEKASMHIYRAARRAQSRRRDEVKEFWDSWLKKHGAGSIEWSGY